MATALPLHEERNNLVNYKSHNKIGGYNMNNGNIADPNPLVTVLKTELLVKLL